MTDVGDALILLLPDSDAVLMVVTVLDADEIKDILITPVIDAVDETDGESEFRSETVEESVTRGDEDTDTDPVCDEDSEGVPESVSIADDDAVE